MLVRPPAEFRSSIAIELPVGKRVCFYHPGYLDVATGDTKLLIMSLPAHDVDDGRPGLHHGFALAACCIIACSRPGWLSTRAPGNTDDGILGFTRIGIAWDAVLPAGDYFYHLNEPSPLQEKYPVVQSFSQWNFSSEAIPSQWLDAVNVPTPEVPAPASKMSDAVRWRDGSCRISNCRDETENAHIVPQQEKDWFLACSMFRYNASLELVGDSIINDVRNGILLRADLHRSFDRKSFCFVVKEGKLVVHFVHPTFDFSSVYHNSEVRLPLNASVEFLWARFAWTIIPSAGVFSRRPGIQIKDLAGNVTSYAEASSSSQPPVARRPAPEPSKAPKRQLRSGANRSGRGKKHRLVTGKEKEAEKIRKPPGGRKVQERNTSCSPWHISQSQLQREHEEDLKVQQEFFPHMAINEEVEYSGAYTWQTSPWYPGIDQTRRLKNWWLRNHPETGPSEDACMMSEGEADALQP